jgi:hypothetical protein
MSFERLRVVFLGLGGILLAAGSLWAAVTPGPVGTRLVGMFGVAFFGVATWALLRMAAKGQTPRAAARPSRYHRLVLPAVLVFTLPWAFKLWFALPLLSAWLALVPQYRDRRALLAGAIFAAVLATAQALFFALVTVGAIAEAHGVGEVSLHVVFLAMVLWLDGTVLWNVRSRLRERRPHIPTPLSSE